MELIPVQVGSKPPADWADTLAMQIKAGESANQWLQNQRRPAVADPELDWTALGLAPHWVGTDSAECAAALEPSIYHGQGAEEFDRFRNGAEIRGETAVVISLIGDPAGTRAPSIRSLFESDGSVSLGHYESYVAGHLLPAGGKVRIAADLSEADKDLALRLRNNNPSLPWHGLSIHGSIQESWEGRVEFPAVGKLVPLLETTLGEPVAAVWLSPDGVERRYIVPVETPWPLLLEWLSSRALPEYVPAAMRRARRHMAKDVELMTRRERDAHAALTALKSGYHAQELSLAEEISSAELDATFVRDGLLYGTGSVLVDAVRVVLESADIAVVDVDEMLGDTKNADLLCTYGGRSRLVEVKSAGGNASERYYEDLIRHLREWPHLDESKPIVGGALILNHQHRVLPSGRSRNPYNRPEFLAAASEPIVTTRSLLDAWREEDTHLIRLLIFGGRNVNDVSSERRDDIPEVRATGKRSWFSRAKRF